jgi:hypothetical protein
VKVIFLLKDELKNETDLVNKYTSKLRMYPIVQIVSYIPATVNKIYNLTTGNSNFTLMLIQGIFDSLTGLMFALVYGFNSSVRASLCECFRAIFCRNSDNRSDNRSSNGINISFQNKERTRSLTYMDDTILTED